MHTKRLMWFGSMAIALLVAGTAKADPFCDDRVVDETGALGPGFSNVQQSADKLAAAGADVRVRVVSSLKGQGNMDQLFEATLRRCSSWQAPGGCGSGSECNRKNNLQALLLMPVRKPDGSFGAKVGLYHGSQWERSLGTKTDATVVTSIIRNDMAPHVRDGRYADGVAAGLNAVTARVESQVANPLPTTPVQPVPVQVPVQPPVVVQTEPTDLTGLWWLGLGVLVIGALVLIAVFIGRIRKSRAEARAAQQNAKTARSSCSSYITELDQPVALYEVAINTAAKVVSEEDVAGQRSKLQQARADLESANQRFRELNDSAGSVNDPDVDGRSQQEYANIAASYEEALTRLRSVKTTAESGRKECETLNRLPAEAKTALDQLDGEIDTALKTVEGIKAQGFQVETQEALLAEAERCYDQAGAAIGQKRFSAAKTLCGQGKAKADKASTDADALPERKAAIDQSITALEARLPGVKAAIQTAKGVAEEIVAGYAESCFKTVAGNGVEAINRYDVASQAPASARLSSSMDKQAWAEAEKTVAGADKVLDEAESLMRSITSLKSNLLKAKQDAPNEIAAARADVMAAKAFIKKNAADINDPLELELFRELDQAEKDVAAAETASTNRDYPKAVQLALSANKAADKVLSRAENDQAATVRQRRLADQAVQQAETAISRSKEYIEDHSSVGPFTAKEKLEEARTLVRNAKATSDLATRISLAEQAEEKAKESLRSAKAAVKKDQESSSQNWGGGYSQPSRSSGGGGDAFLGGLAGGVIGSSIGRASTPSPSPRRDTGGDSIFGGGGGGSFDIGGSSGGGGGSFDIGGGGGGGGGSADI